MSKFNDYEVGAYGETDGYDEQYLVDAGYFNESIDNYESEVDDDEL